MALRFDLESMPGVAIGVADGALSLDQAKAAAAEMWDKLEGPEIRILWDLREAAFDLSMGEVRGLGDFVRRQAPSANLRTAFVVSKDLEFGLAKMFSVFREKPGAQASVFREMEEALEWLVPTTSGPESS